MAKRKKLTKTDEELQAGGRLGQFGSAIAQICEEKGIFPGQEQGTITACKSGQVTDITHI